MANFLARRSVLRTPPDESNVRPAPGARDTIKRARGASQNRPEREARRSQYVDIGKASDKAMGDYGRTPLGLARFWLLQLPRLVATCARNDLNLLADRSPKP